MPALFGTAKMEAERFEVGWGFGGPSQSRLPRIPPQCCAASVRCYSHTTTFLRFPFPEGMTPDKAVTSARALPSAPKIEAAAKRLDKLRNGWHCPADHIQRVPEVVAAGPERIVAKDRKAARVLPARTLTALYNERPGRMAEARRTLDEAVAEAYRWPADIGGAGALAGSEFGTVDDREPMVTLESVLPAPKLKCRLAAFEQFLHHFFYGGNVNRAA